MVSKFKLFPHIGPSHSFQAIDYFYFQLICSILMQTLAAAWDAAQFNCFIYSVVHKIHLRCFDLI